jgi:hypothetical protein
MRTFRHNEAMARLLEPWRCEVCEELADECLRYTDPKTWATFAHVLCCSCRSHLTVLLEAQGIPYQVDLLANTA